MPLFHFILIFIEFTTLRHLIKNICTHHRWHHTVRTYRRTQSHSRKGLIWIHLTNTVFIFFINLRRNAILIFYSIRILFHSTLASIKILLQSTKVIWIHCGKHIRHHLNYFNLILWLFLCIWLLFVCFFIIRRSTVHPDHHGCQIKACTLYLQRIFWKRLFLYVLNILIHTCR